MSKQSEAKERQQYTAKLIPGTCSNCEHFQFDRALPEWMEQHNKDRAHVQHFVPYTVDKHGLVKNMRCGIGGFAVKKLGSCTEHAFVDSSEMQD